MTNWKNIKSADLKVLQNHYLKSDPYADFNVVNLWGYMAPDMRWALVGDTIVYELTNYHTSQKYYSMLGGTSAKDAVRFIADVSNATDKLDINNVPNDVYTQLKDWAAVIESAEDHDNHDYIFKVDSLVNFSSRKFRRKKPAINKLMRKHPRLRTVVLDHRNPNDRQAMYRMFKRWVKVRNSTGWETEYKALQRALNLKDFSLVCIGIRDGRKLVGFTVNEPEKNHYYQGHYGKSDYSYQSLGILLEHETAKYMQKHHRSEYLNLQQDLGIEGIRYYKSSLGPCKKLKKFNIVIDTRQLQTA